MSQSSSSFLLRIRRAMFSCNTDQARVKTVAPFKLFRAFIWQEAPDHRGQQPTSISHRLTLTSALRTAKQISRSSREGRTDVFIVGAFYASSTSAFQAPPRWLKRKLIVNAIRDHYQQLRFSE